MRAALFALLLSAGLLQGILDLQAQQAKMTITLGWDANAPADQVTKYTLYEYMGTSWVMVQETTATQVELTNIPVGEHTWAVTATNIAGLESLRSDTLTTPGPPSPPRSFRAITIYIQP